MPFWRKIYIALLENKKTPSRRLGIIKSPGDILRGHLYKYKCFCKGFYAATVWALSRFVCERVCKFLQRIGRGYGRGANIKRFFLSNKRIAAATKISPIPGPIWLLASKKTRNKRRQLPTPTFRPRPAITPLISSTKNSFFLLFFVGQKMLIHKGKRNQHHGHP